MASFRTIVGGRASPQPGGSSFPRGIELLLKKAKADEEFRHLLLDDPAAAAAEIQLELSETESAILSSMPVQNLEAAINHTRVPAEHAQLFRSARTATALAVALTLTIGVPSFATAGMEEVPYEIENWDEVAIERMAAIQKALEDYRGAHGDYPSTLAWITEDNPLEGLVPRTYVFDPYYQRFHYEAILEDGKYANYRLEMIDLEGLTAAGYVRCPVDPDRHSFVHPNPVTITYPRPEQLVYAAAVVGEPIEAVLNVQAQHESPNATLSWHIDGKLVGKTDGTHDLSVTVSAGVHELICSDETGNSATVVFSVVEER